MELTPSIDIKSRYDFWIAAKRAGTLTLLAVLVGACGSPSSSVGASPTAKPSQGHEATATSVSTQPSGATLTFNALGGGSNIIQVYPGPANTSADKIYDGTYYSGETVLITCETTGRTVTSHPAVGEAYRQSDEWYKLQTPAGWQPEYATAVYADEHGSVAQC